MCDVIMLNSEEMNLTQKIAKLQESKQSQDVLLSRVSECNLPMDEKLKLIDVIEDMFLSPADRLRKQVKKEAEEKAKQAREEKLRKIGEASKKVINGLGKGKDVALGAVGVTSGSILKGLINPFKQGWDRVK